MLACGSTWSRPATHGSNGGLARETVPVDLGTKSRVGHLSHLRAFSCQGFHSSTELYIQYPSPGVWWVPALMRYIALANAEPNIGSVLTGADLSSVRS